MCGAQAGGRRGSSWEEASGTSRQIGVAGRARPATRPAHLLLLVVADAAHQVLQVLVEHAVDAALDHLEGHNGGGRRAGAPGGLMPGAVRGPRGRPCRPRSAAPPAATAGRATRPGLRRSGAERRQRRDPLGRSRSPPLTLHGTCKWRTRWWPVS